MPRSKIVYDLLSKQNTVLVGDGYKDPEKKVPAVIVGVSGRNQNLSSNIKILYRVLLSTNQQR
jgi:hypothetical protein